MFVIFTLYAILIVTICASGDDVMVRLFTVMFGNQVAIPDLIVKSNASVLSCVACSNSKAPIPAPNVGLKNLSNCPVRK